MAPVAFHEFVTMIPTDDKIHAVAKDVSHLSTVSFVLPTEMQLERQRRKEDLAAALRIFGKKGFDHYTVSASFVHH
jgi:hypothetical protein